MSDKKKDPTRIVIGPVRLGYVHFAEPDYDEDKEASFYRCQVLVPTKASDLIKKVKRAIQAATIAKFGKDKAVRILKSSKFKTPLRDPVEEDLEQEEYKGMQFFNAKSSEKRRPGYVLKNRTRLTNKEDIEREFYSGVWAYISLSFYYFQKQNQGIAVSINNVMKEKDDESLTGGSTPEEDFGDLFEEDEDDDFGDLDDDLDDDDDFLL